MDFDRFLQQICPQLDLEWRKYRRRAARHRVEGRIRSLGLDNFASYLEFLHKSSAEAAVLADLMRVTVSRFFRDRSCWIHLAREILPQLITEKSRGRTLRVWSAGCCGGEEPYSVALVWLEYVQPLFPEHTCDILATDIDDMSLERARRGLYGTGSLREVPAGIRERWFCRKNGIWLIDEKVKELVRLEKRNLMTDAVPEGIDLALCRYLAFTYYRGKRRSDAAKRLWDSLRPRGALMIGSKEAIDVSEHLLFDPWPGNGGFFRKKERNRPPSPL